MAPVQTSVKPIPQTRCWPDSNNKQRQNVRNKNMKTENNKNLLRAGVAIAMAMAAWLPTTATAADEPMKPMKAGEHQTMLLKGADSKQEADTAPGSGMKMMEGKMMERCQEMKAQKEKMMTEMKAQDSELTAQIARMNSAPENAKLDLMAAVVTHMMEQRTAMNARMEKMREGMMQHMMQHMQMGKESMSQCPMMKGMKGMDEASADAHKAHQAEQK
jgi:hypothetical protein